MGEEKREAVLLGRVRIGKKEGGSIGESADKERQTEAVSLGRVWVGKEGEAVSLEECE